MVLTNIGSIISDIIDYRGKTPLKLGGNWESPSAENYRALSAKNVKTGKIVQLDEIRYVSPELYKKWMKQEVQRGDILITSEAPFGQIFYWNSDEKIVLSQRLFAIRVKKNINPKYAYYYMISQAFQGEMRARSTGSTVEGLRQPALKRCSFAYPDLVIQNKIADILWNYDQLIENNNRRIKILEDMAESLYKEWFVRFRFPGYETAEFENGIPKGWKISNLLQIINLNDSMRKPLSSLERDAMDKIYPYYGAAELLDKVDNYIFDGRYLLMGEDGSVITPGGYPVLQYVEGKFWVNNHAHVISGNNTYPLNFLYCLLKKMPIIDIVTGAAQPKISQGRMQKKKVVIPTDDLIKKFCTIVDDIFDDEFCLKALNEKLVKQRDALLPRLMSGKLEVNINNSNHGKESFGEILTLSQYKQQLLQGMAARASSICISDDDIKAAYEAYVNDRRKKS